MWDHVAYVGNEEHMEEALMDRGGYRRGARGAQAPLSSPNYT